MYNVVSKLYLFHSNPLELLKSDYPTFTAKALRLSQALIALAQLKRLAEDLSNLVKLAERMLLTTRTIVVEESWEIRGVISWPQTTINLSRLKPPAQLMFRHTLYSSENILLKLIIEELLSLTGEFRELIASEYKEFIELLKPLKLAPLYGYRILISEVDSIQYVLKGLLKKSFLNFIPYITIPHRVHEIRRLIKMIKLQPWRPEWVNKLLIMANKVITFKKSLENLYDILTHTKYRRIDELVRGVRFLIWKLYELYVLYLILEAIKDAIPYIKIKGHEREFYVQFNKSKILLLYNKQPLIKGIPSRIGNGVGKGLISNRIPRELLKASSGRPDISLVRNNNIVILEVKFTRNPHYLTQSRFKVLAYMYEYNAKVGVLVYPGIRQPKELRDDEDIETIRLLTKAEKKGGMEIELISGSRIFILPIKPYRSCYAQNKYIISKILTSILM